MSSRELLKKNKAKLESLTKQNKSLMGEAKQLTGFKGNGKNDLAKLQNILFETIDKLNDPNVTDDDVKRASVMNEVAKSAIANAKIIIKCIDELEGGVA